MKVLVVTDSHGRLDYLMEMYEREKPDIVISAGDYSEDVEELSYVYEDSKYYIVRGNCDYMDRNNEDNLEIDLGEKKVFITHGHLYGVKTSYDYLRMEAKGRECDLCIFGHTHIPFLEEDTPTLFNPGAAKDKVYGIIRIKNDILKIEQKKL